MFPSHVQAVINEFLPRIRALAEGRYAISLGGSTGRQQMDQYSDIDFRLFCDALLTDSDQLARLQQELDAAIEETGKKGLIIDGYWTRLISDVSARLDQWCQGQIVPEDLIWTVWGYHLPSDIYNQTILDDPHGIIAGWKEQVRRFPPPLKQALLDKHLNYLRYWQQDYHYRNKVKRQDLTFLAGLSVSLVHSMIQILFALNEVYYVGDGNNLSFLRGFKHVPGDFIEKVETVLYPAHAETMYEQQRSTLIHLIDEIEALVNKLGFRVAPVPYI